MNPFINEAKKTLGIEGNSTSHSEKIISAVGVLTGMACCYAITQYYLSPNNAQLFVASMAASAVLLFAVPHGALSQPWPLMGGHIISAIIGVSCYQLLGSSLISACSAVSLSVLIMYYLGCLHPPGGATAFFFVTSGVDIHALGYDFVWLIIASNCACLLVIAIIFNSFFHWRRYPAHLFLTPNERALTQSNLSFSQEDVTAALHHVNSFVDVTPDDLIQIFEHAQQHAQKNSKQVTAIETGKFYSNGLLGHNWNVYQVLSCTKRKVVTNVVAGIHNQQKEHEWRLRDFKKTIRQEVRTEGKHWVKT